MREVQEGAMAEVIGVRFKEVGKIYYFDPKNIQLKTGDKVIVETARGIECGVVALANKDIPDEEIVHPLKPLIRIATDNDISHIQENKKREKEAFSICEKKIAEHKLDMNLVDVEYTFDNNKILFYFTADGRVDFRALVKDLASVFRTRIELRQIGVRDEAKMLGGLGVCGRPFCCCSFKRQFDSINIKLAHDQSMPITPSKISGTCGRLLCCLNYEYKNYIETAKEMVPIGSGVMTVDGVGRVCGLNILSNKVSVKLSDGKIKEFPSEEVEMIDTDVNIEIDVNTTYKYASMQQTDENVDIRQFEDDRNSSTGNI